DLRQAAGVVLVSLQSLPRGNETGEGEAGARTAGVAVQAVDMVISPAHDLVARCHLPCEADRMVPPFAVVFGLRIEIGSVGPFAVIARIQVVPHARDGLQVPLVAEAGEEPQSVTLDWAAERR